MRERSGEEMREEDIGRREGSQRERRIRREVRIGENRGSDGTVMETRRKGEQYNSEERERR